MVKNLIANAVPNVCMERMDFVFKFSYMNLKIILLDYQNNYVRMLKLLKCKTFYNIISLEKESGCIN